MKFRLITVGTYYSKAQAERLMKLGFTFEPANEPQIKKQHNPSFRMTESDVFIEINTFKELLEFSNEWGNIIIDQDTIQIFDDRLE